MDELEDEEDETTAARLAEALLKEADNLLRPDEQGTEFQREYHRALQQSPEAMWVHGQWKRREAKK